MPSRVKNLLSYLFNSFLDLIYKRKCLICGCSKTDNLLCKTCGKNINYLSGYAHKIYKEIPIYSASIYKENTKKLIHLLKFTHKKSASIPLGEMLFSYFRKTDLYNNKNIYTIVFPNSFILKNAQKGYNHMSLIASEFSRLSGFQVEKNFIQKIKYTKPQYKAKNRHKNIKGSFRINDKLINQLKNKNILLIDDITTSGATLEEIIDCLKEKNINNIVCLTIAKSQKVSC